MRMKDTQSFSLAQNLKLEATVGHFFYNLRIHENFGDVFKEKIHDGLNMYHYSFLVIESADHQWLVFKFFPLL
jgi:hypothetical protein